MKSGGIQLPAGRHQDSSEESVELRLCILKVLNLQTPNPEPQSPQSTHLSSHRKVNCNCHGPGSGKACRSPCFGSSTPAPRPHPALGNERIKSTTLLRPGRRLMVTMNTTLQHPKGFPLTLTECCCRSHHYPTTVRAFLTPCVARV